MSFPVLVFTMYLAHVPANRPKAGRTAARPGPSNSAAQVLQALAERADDDGRNAFPSVDTLSITTRLSERSVRDLLDLLEDDGSIRPSEDPGIVAARIKRADQRPQSWDINMHRRHPGPCSVDLAGGGCGWKRPAYRDDLTPKQLARLWRAVPLVQPFVEEMLTALADDTERGQAAADVLATLPAPFAPRQPERGANGAARGANGASNPAPRAQEPAPFAPDSLDSEEHSLPGATQHVSPSSSSAVADATPDQQSERPDVEHLCTLMADLIEGNGCKRPKITAAWRTECRRMLDLDARDPAQAERVMRWATQDEFWKTNILALPTFRKQYDKLRLKADAEQTPKRPQDVGGFGFMYGRAPAPAPPGAAVWDLPPARAERVFDDHGNRIVPEYAPRSA